MNIADQLQKEFNIVKDFLIKENLILEFRPLNRYSYTDKITYCWELHPSLSYLFDEFFYISHYQELLNKRHYNFVLLDGSVIQISYTFCSKKIIYHRLAYYTCPFVHSDLNLKEYPVSLADLPDYFDKNEFMHRFIPVTTLRFDYDPASATVDHPHSHLTFGSQNCRIPVYGPVSLPHFIRLIFRNFYPKYYPVINKIKGFSYGHYDSKTILDSQKEFYFDSLP